MKIVAISDLHGQYDVEIPNGDMLIIAGDVTNNGSIVELVNFARRYGKYEPHKYKIFVAGNHDLCFEDTRKDIAKQILKDNGIIYLENEEIIIEGIKIYGTPYLNRHYNWAFMETEDRLDSIYDLIPNDLDILITHGPAYSICDTNIKNERCGSITLLTHIISKKPKYHIHGHIHEANGIETTLYSTTINCSILNERYKKTHRPIEFTMEENINGK